MNTTQRTMQAIIDSAQLLRGLTDRDDAGDLYATVQVDIMHAGKPSDLAGPIRKRIEREIARHLCLADWTLETRDATATGERWTYRRPAHRPRRDPAAARVVRSYRLHPDTIARIDAEAKRTGESAGQFVDRLAATLGND